MGIGFRPSEDERRPVYSILGPKLGYVAVRNGRHVLQNLASVYHNDALAGEQKLSPEDRLRFRQERSGPIMQELQQWMKAQIAEHRVEPNSGLGKAFSYLLKHWKKLTLFLSQPGAPLDNNVVERALKKAILNRRNALSHKRVNGAAVGDQGFSDAV